MTSDQYTELVGFLGVKFDGIDRRFEGIDRRFENIDRRFENIDRRFEDIDRRFEGIDRQFEEVRRHATVLFEQARDERRLMMEGFDARFTKVVEDHERRLEALESP